jgi:hypothetical protein
MTKPGQDVNGIARTEADHHMKCPACGQWFDMRDLGQVADIHDDSEIDGRASRPNRLCTECGAPGAVNIVPNWHDRQGHALPFSRGRKAPGG